MHCRLSKIDRKCILGSADTNELREAENSSQGWMTKIQFPQGLF